MKREENIKKRGIQMALSIQGVSGETTNALGEAVLKAGNAINTAKEFNRDVSGLEPPVADVFFFVIIILIIVIGVAFFYLVKETT